MGTTAYKVTVGGKPTVFQAKYLEPYIDEELQVMEHLAVGPMGDAEAFRVFQTGYRLKRPLEGSYYSYLGSKTLFNPYQFKPLIKFLSAGSEERLFIADEVGVGKTIEAGIIMTELIARGRVDRKTGILVVCPNILGPKWEKELRERFNLPFHIHDSKSLLFTLQTALHEGRIPEKYAWGIVGLQLLRGEKYMSLLQQLSASRESELWSLVAVDEAHHMRNTGTESNELGNVLSSLTEMMLMLSATPLNLRDEDLFNQMHILNPSLFPDAQTFNAMLSPVKTLNRCRRLLTSGDHAALLSELDSLETGALGPAFDMHPSWQKLKHRLSESSDLTVSETANYDRLLATFSPLDHSFTRTLKREALSHRVTREVLKVPVDLSHAEREFHDRVIDLSISTFLERGGHPAALGFITNMPRRMASSCIPAMRDYLEWCLTNGAALGGVMDDEEAQDEMHFGRVPLSKETAAAYHELKILAESLGPQDSKYEQFISLLKQMRGPLDNPQIIVFSFFVRTLRYLQKRLTADGFRVGLISGEVPLHSDGTTDGRYEIMEAFKNKQYDILLSSEVGGEGLDFQFCQAVINYDLPYNPMRIEQRIGRVDRFGQTADKVLVASMYIKDTVDEMIYERLYERIRLVENSVGTLEPILEHTLLDLQRDIISGALTQEQIEIRTREMELAVEQAALEMKKFEEGRSELLGEDSFTAVFSNLEAYQEFVTPSDASALTKYYLSRVDGCSYQSSDANRGIMKLTPAVRIRLERFTRRPGMEGSSRELSQLFCDGEISVLFNGSYAHVYPDHAFLPPCGYWSRFMLSELDAESAGYRVFGLSMAAEGLGLSAGDYVVPLFEVLVEGFRKEVHMAAVPYSLESNRLEKTAYLDFARKLGSASSFDTGGLFNFPAPSFIEECRATVEDSMESRLDEMRAEHVFRRDSRIISLRRGSEARVNRLMHRIQQHTEKMSAEGMRPNDEFIRLTEAQIEREKSRSEDLIKIMGERTNVSLNISLLAVAALRVE
jgi:superfamily II DNA or RNA helicase